VSRCAYFLKSIRDKPSAIVSPLLPGDHPPDPIRCKVLHIVQHNFVQMECRQKMTPEVRPTFGNHHSFGSQYGDSFMYESAQMDECLSLRDHIAGCIRDAKHAFKIMEPASLSKRCSKQTRRLCFTLLLNEYGRVLVSQPEAVKLGDRDRATRMTIKLKDIFFDRTPSSYFVFDKYPKLRHPEQWAKCSRLNCITQQQHPELISALVWMFIWIEAFGHANARQCCASFYKIKVEWI